MHSVGHDLPSDYPNRQFSIGVIGGAMRAICGLDKAYKDIGVVGKFTHIC